MENNMESLVYIALFAPFVGSLFAGLFFARREKTHLVGVVNSMLIAVAVHCFSDVGTACGRVWTCACKDDGVDSHWWIAD